MPCRKAFRSTAAAVLAALAIVVAPPALAQEAFQKGLDAYLHGNYTEALEYWRPAAEAGNAVAAFNIGVLHAQGLGVETDHAEAVRWYRTSALAGYANAQFNLGAAYFNGEGTEVNLGQAASWWEKAAQQDHPEAMYNLATLYRQGKGVEKNPKRAIELFERAAALGDARAQQVLATMAPRSSDPEQAVAPAEPSSESSPAPEPEAPQSASGGLAADPSHWTVQIFAAEEEQAARDFVRKHGLSGAVRIYRAEVDGATWYKGIYGSYADKQDARAARDELESRLGSPPWVRSFRAVQSEAVAEIQTAGAGTQSSSGTEDRSDAGSGTTREPEETQEQSAGSEPPRADTGETAMDDESDSEAPARTAAADTGGQDPRAALRQGQQAFNDQNYRKAMKIWRPLAEQGVPEAQYGVGFMYESGWGVDRSFDEAFRWYQLAAQQGHVKSQYNLGMLYRNGQGVTRNDALGLYWIQTAADRGDERAVSYLKNLN